jgi:hypothetical protein
MKKICLVAFLLTLLISSSSALAHDTDLYVLDQSMEQVPPDLLFIFDLSGSMRYTPAGEYMFIPDTTSCTNPSDSDSYCRTNHCSKNCASTTPFYSTSATGHTRQCRVDIYSSEEYPSASHTWPRYGSTSCSGPFYKTYSGSDSSRNTNCSRVEIAKRAIKRILDGDNDGTVEDEDKDALDMRMGYMRFYSCGSSSSDSGSDYANGCNKIIKPLDTPYSQIWTAVSGENAYSGTHVAYSLKEAKLYLNAHKSTDNAKACRKKFAILITDGQDTLSCSGDGNDWQSTQYKRRREMVARAKDLADGGYLVFVVGFGADMPYFLKNTLNWAAYYGGVDNPGVEPNTGNINAYPIPYSLYPPGLTGCASSTTTCRVYKDLIKTPPVQTSCTAGSSGCYCYASTNDPGQASLGGYAFLAENATELEEALDVIRNYIIAILAKSTSYVAPVVPISQMEQTSSQNRLYLGMFKPTTTGFWKGNLKKYAIATEDESDIDRPPLDSTTSPFPGTEDLDRNGDGNLDKVGDIIDASTPYTRVIGAQNKIRDAAKSFWSATVDGADVERGGVAELLINRLTDRTLYTYLGTDTNLTGPSNAFAVSNSALTPTHLGLASGDTAGRNNIINFAHGLDAYDENGNGDRGEKRDCIAYPNNFNCILGAIIHSRPLVIHHPEKSVIYVGANDGMLHAFDNQSGEELWAFVPPAVLGNLKKFETELSLQFFVDGSPRAYIERDSSNNIVTAVIVFGLRRGGNRYTALDVSDPLAPRFLWEISPSTAGYGEMGQTWSTPRMGKIKYGSGEKQVIFVGAGYDTRNDSIPVPGPDIQGRGVYVIDVLTGNQVWKYTHAENSEMTYCIPSDITRVDTNGDGYIDRFYVGDLGGRIWRFDIKNPNPAGWSAKRIFQADGKIFYPPDVTLEKDSDVVLGDNTRNYEMLFFGTGDREDPKNMTSVSKLYAIKDKNPASMLTEASLVDVTQDHLQDADTSEEERKTLLDELKTASGWYISLAEHAGEKCLAEAVVFAGSVYYTTFTPVLGDVSDVCFVGEGTARVYILNFKNGNATFNLDGDNDLPESPVIAKSDRSMTSGTGIPSGVILAIVKGIVTGYGGIGGGIFSPPLPSTKPLVPLNWKIVF